MSRLTGFDAYGLMEAYSAVYTSQQKITEEQIWEEVETWVNSLVEEGYDLSEYSWEEMYEEYITEIGIIPSGAAGERQKRANQQFNQSMATLGRRMITGRVEPKMGGSSTTASIGAAPTAAAKQTPTTSPRPQFGTTTPRGSSVPSTGVSGLSAADRAAYSAGGGNAAAQRGMGRTTAQVIAQGRTNLGRMDQGRPAPAPVSRPSASASARTATTPRSSTAPVRPTATASPKQAATPTSTSMKGFQLAKQGVDLSKPSTTAAPTSTATSTSTAAPARPSLASQTAELRKMRQASQQRIMAQGGTPVTPLVQSFDPFDVVMGYLIDEGYAETEEAAAVIMANMSDEWRESIVESEEKKEKPEKPFTGEGPKKPKGWKPKGPKRSYGQRPPSWDVGR